MAICDIDFQKDLFGDLIYQNFLPYWRQFEDKEYGGILNCINNFGDMKLSNDKFIWSQGRYLWILSELYHDTHHNINLEYNDKSILKQMDLSYHFIKTYGISREKDCYYLLSREGTPLIDPTSNSLKASIFADCFALIGMANYIKITKNATEVAVVVSLYQNIVTRIERGAFFTEPYPIANGYLVHSINMIMVNVTLEYMKMLESFHISCEKEISYAEGKVQFILTALLDENLLREYIKKDGIDNVYLLGRHINPGHTFESLWFLIDFIERYGSLEQYIHQIGEIAKKTFSLSWDKDHGGILRFIDYTGTAPQGALLGDRYEELILDTFDMKLWWPHSEALYLFLLLYKHTHNEDFLEIYHKIFQYTFKVFPNHTVGEWVQILTKEGLPSQKVVALPVKDPFHILRNFILITHI